MGHVNFKLIKKKEALPQPQGGPSLSELPRRLMMAHNASPVQHGLGGVDDFTHIIDRGPLNLDLG